MNEQRTWLVSLTGIERFAEYTIGPSASGRWERCTTVAAGAGQVSLAAPLANAYAAGVEFKSHRLFYRVSSSTATSIERNCRAEWRYSVDGVARRIGVREGARKHAHGTRDDSRPRRGFGQFTASLGNDCVQRSKDGRNDLRPFRR